MVHSKFSPWGYSLDRTQIRNILYHHKKTSNISIAIGKGFITDTYTQKTDKRILMIMLLRWNQNISYKEEGDTHLVIIQYIKYGIEIGKHQEKVLVEKENQLDIFICLGQNSVRLKVIWQQVHVYKMLLLIMPLGLENTPTNRNCKDIDFLEEWKIPTWMR